jgi:hypothetical protein
MKDGLTAPYTFVSAVSSGAASMTSRQIVPVAATRSRLSGSVVVPLTVQYTDSAGRAGTANASITLPRDVELNTPPRALVPFETEVSASVVSESGTFISPDQVNIVCCGIILTKITVQTDIAVPSYGLAAYPQNCGDQADPCAGLFSLPLFPPLS